MVSMVRKNERLIEPVILFLAIMCQIWIHPILNNSHFAALGLALTAASSTLRGDSPLSLGLWPIRCSREQAERVAFLAFLGLGISFVMGIAFHPSFLRRESLEVFSWKIVAYLPWALVQWTVMGFFASRFSSCGYSRRQVALQCGTLFALAHLPNPALVLVAFLCGTLGTYAFLMERNVYAIALAHALLGAAIRSIFHAPWVVGPSYFRH
jgi:membrane protease YdiL (CAAX protease family)